MIHLLRGKSVIIYPFVNENYVIGVRRVKITGIFKTAFIIFIEKINIRDFNKYLKNMFKFTERFDTRVVAFLRYNQGTLVHTVTQKCNG